VTVQHVQPPKGEVLGALTRPRSPDDLPCQIGRLGRRN
jgi:hypothetical protein